MLPVQLWEESQAENEQLRQEMAAIRAELVETRRRLQEAVTVGAQAATPWCLAQESELGRDNAAMEARLARMQGEIRELRGLREENEELRTQNR